MCGFGTADGGRPERIPKCGSFCTNCVPFEPQLLCESGMRTGWRVGWPSYERRPDFRPEVFSRDSALRAKIPAKVDGHPTLPHGPESPSVVLAVAYLHPDWLLSSAEERVAHERGSIA